LLFYIIRPLIKTMKVGILWQYLVKNYLWIAFLY